ncbi:nucleolar protein 8-like [Adelges cooleyi]|uniref:nucleolar protein 8-like n=1 Tax=Adelges cooleyi TaxID=133065 RepID=UPI00217F9FDF|nr:nucleolar protein 8-like [Adelges cooleyi]
MKQSDVNEDNGEIEYKRNLPAFGGIGSLQLGISKKENNVNKKKIQEAEEKRQSALAEKWTTLQNQKSAIANALKGESLNKKIKFDDNGSQRIPVEKPSKKMSLFEDNDTNENNEELVSDFKMKLRFEGEKGKKLFKMQTAKATGDDRFMMDKRFFDDQEAIEKLSDDEIEKQMNILEGVVGRTLTKPKKAEMEDRMFNMVRYDPTQEDHKKYIKDKPELPKQKRQKKQNPKSVMSKVATEPVVDTKKYFKINEKLKDVFSSESQFSLTSLFPASKKHDGNEEEYQTEQISKSQKMFGKNPFIDDSSDSDNDEDDNEYNKESKDDDNVNVVPSEKILGSRGVWREMFFFKIDDSRFKDAEEFYDPQYNKGVYSGSQDPRFIKKRDMLREFLKSKNKRHKREVGKKMFVRKLGGTRNNSSKVNKKSLLKNKVFPSKNRRKPNDKKSK